MHVYFGGFSFVHYYILVFLSTWGVISVGGFLQSSTQPHESAVRPLQRAAGHINGTCPLVNSSCHHGKVQASKQISITSLWSPESLIIHEQSRANFVIHGCPTLMVTHLFKLAVSFEQTKSAVGFSPQKLKLLYSIREGLLHTEGFIEPLAPTCDINIVRLNCHCHVKVVIYALQLLAQLDK